MKCIECDMKSTDFISLAIHFISRVITCHVIWSVLCIVVVTMSHIL